ncbi:Activating transcription factor 7-interacting protein 1 [Chionoecetes opilio]|uniref:Activating transcription factor 7-interacting protein 1 n=1 Tax=Chionoecetes opilio TaxID=41210 RepID=A0A8J4YA62_CHIOP|nr:Activating transcription factor 7-interacting protein 1 [Chionoecetes opilio]
MKDLDISAAPMISVPAGVLKEFMPTGNSSTPTPPLSGSSSTLTITTAPSEAASPSSSKASSLSLVNGITAAQSTPNNNTSNNTTVKSRTPTPTTSRTSSPLLSLSIERTSVTLTPAGTNHVNGNVTEEEEEKKDSVTGDSSVTKTESSSPVVNGIKASSPQPLSPSSSCITMGMKRPSDDEDGKPDLKKIRVFSSINKEGLMNRNIAVTEVNQVSQALDLDSKKILEVKKRNTQSLVTLSRIKNGIAMLQGDKLSSPESPSLSHSSTPSPSAVVGQEGEDAGTPGLPEQAFAPTQEMDTADKENLRTSPGKSVKLSKKELKDNILRAFTQHTLYASELGGLKQMCEKLTATLESNMRKVAQFHKEIEDLRKVTTRLSAEHQARKGQYVAPIRIKRSVGIQAAPHIINKGIMHASVSGGNIKTISPRTPNMVGMLPTSMGQNLVPPGSTLGIITTNAGIGKPGTLTGLTASTQGLPGGAHSLGTAARAPHNYGQIMMMAPAGSMQPLIRPSPGEFWAASNIVKRLSTTTMLPVAQRVVRAPLGNLGSVAPQPGTLIGTQRPILIQNDKGATAAPTLQSALTAARSGGVIDLTDEDEGSKGLLGRNAMVPKAGTLLKVPTTATAQLVPLQAGGMGQVVLLPNSSGGQPTTALIVSQVSAGQTLDSIANPAVAQARMSTVVHTSSTNRVQVATPPTRTVPSPTTALQQPNSQIRHPAPLPKTPFQQVGGISKKLPPQPTLKLSHKDSSIVLSWTMAKTEDHETIASYQLYAYQEGAAPPSANLWKKVGSVKALELPMACTLTQFMPGHVYHFAVRAVDTKSRLGPFSDPRSIRLDKK